MHIQLDVELPCHVRTADGMAVIRFLPLGEGRPSGRYEVVLPDGEVFVFGHRCAHEEGVLANAHSPVVRPVVESLLKSGQAREMVGGVF